MSVKKHRCPFYQQPAESPLVHGMEMCYAIGPLQKACLCVLSCVFCHNTHGICKVGLISVAQVMEAQERQMTCSKLFLETMCQSCLQVPVLHVVIVFCVFKFFKLPTLLYCDFLQGRAKFY
jgi:hypothetical protein